MLCLALQEIPHWHLGGHHVFRVCLPARVPALTDAKMKMTFTDNFLMLYPGVERHGTSVNLEASGKIGKLYASSRQHAGAAANVRGLGRMNYAQYSLFAITYWLAMDFSHCTFASGIARVNTPASMLKIDGRHPC